MLRHFEPPKINQIIEVDVELDRVTGLKSVMYCSINEDRKMSLSMTTLNRLNQKKERRGVKYS